MGKLNFCPYDGKRIELNNLAYELIFPTGWDWDRVKNETIISDKAKMYIVENDTKRQAYLDFVDKENHVILLENSENGEKNGLDLLKEFLVGGEDNSSDHEKIMKRIYNMKFFENDSRLAKENEFVAGEESSVKHLHYAYHQDLDTFLDDNDDPVMYAMPCCPYCHNRLPLGWTTADDFVGISMLGAAGVGKTSFLYSLLHNQAACLEDAILVNGEYVSIRPAHYLNDRKDSVFAHVNEQAARMCQANGACPIAEKETALPVFLNVRYKSGDSNKSMIVGLYNKVEDSIMKLETLPGDHLHSLLGKMYADMFLFDPRALNIKNISSKKIAGNTIYKKGSLMTLEEQAEFQRKNKGVRIKAEELLEAKAATENIATEPVPTMDLYYKITSFYRRFLPTDTFQHRRFVGVISKCDLLSENDDLRLKDMLFKGNGHSLETILARSNQTKNMMMDNSLLGHTDLNQISVDYKKGATWHIVSALGCDTVERDHLLGAYNPKMVGDPIITIVYERMKENGWF